MHSGQRYSYYCCELIDEEETDFVSNTPEKSVFISPLIRRPERIPKHLRTLFKRYILV